MRLILHDPHIKVSMHTHLDMRMEERGWALDQSQWGVIVVPWTLNILTWQSYYEEKGGRISSL